MSKNTGALPTVSALDGAAESAQAVPTVERVRVFEPNRGARHYWRDIWDYRELFHVLAWRDVAVRYKQTIVGAAWAIIRPLLTVIVFTVIFGTLASARPEICN